MAARSERTASRIVTSAARRSGPAWAPMRSKSASWYSTQREFRSPGKGPPMVWKSAGFAAEQSSSSLTMSTTSTLSGRRKPAFTPSAWPTVPPWNSSAEVEGVHVLSAYFPNGGRLGSDKYAYKLAWMERLREYLARRFDPAKDRVVLAGDYNVAYPKDVAEPEEYEGTVLCNDEVRAAIAAFREWGMSDLFEPFHPKGGVYSWWDYRARGFERNAGLRIDHVYGTTPLAGRVIGAAVDRAERVPNGMGTAEEKKKQGKKVGPSDHAPVLVELDL